ncbi:hypothetical protein LJC54_03005 [Parabacteroides sp. OttesenSCG-928-J18]|nr:hypothetical protein [Parabacteroides sp. OttesenSCG-928-J18]
MRTKLSILLMLVVALLCNSCGSDDPEDILQDGSIYTVEFISSGEDYSVTASFSANGKPMIDTSTKKEFLTTVDFTGKKTFQTKEKVLIFGAGATLSSKKASQLQMTVKKDGVTVWTENVSINPEPENTRMLYENVAYVTGQ